jgi:hypothetical protein
VSTALAFLAHYGALGDADVYYHPWAIEAAHQGNWRGINSPSVYPLVAVLPMVFPLVLPTELYDLGWILLIELMNAVAFYFLLRVLRRRGTIVAAWWWLLFMWLLGAISITRLDSVAVPLCIVAMLFAIGRPRLAAALLTVATWIKVWPVAIIAALLAADWRWRTARMVLGISVTIVILALVFGGGLNFLNIISFATAQGGRGLEIGAPVSTIWLWMARGRVPGTAVVYNQRIQAFEVAGPGSAVAGTIVTVLTTVALVSVLLLVLRARRRGAPQPELLAFAALAALLAVIVFNKVGSPQYIEMLAVPVVAGLVVRPGRFVIPAVLAFAVAFLTQLTFPWFFLKLVALDESLLVVVTLRNLLLIAVFVWALVELWRMPLPVVIDRTATGSNFWPFPAEASAPLQPASRAPKARR